MKTRLSLAVTKLISASALGAVLLSSCAGVSPDSLHRVTDHRQVAIDSDIAWTVKSMAFSDSVETRYTLSKGMYVAEFADEAGTYFKGPDDCFSSEVISTSSESLRLRALGKVVEISCGLHVPSNSLGEVKWYRYAGSDGRVRGDATPAPGTSPNIVEPAVQIGIGLFPSNATGIALGTAGGLIAATAIHTLAAAEKGNVFIDPRQPGPGVLRRAVSTASSGN
jgi:hypothetical protein